MSQCPSCHGQGLLDSDGTLCDVCNGSGTADAALAPALEILDAKDAPAPPKKKKAADQ